MKKNSILLNPKTLEAINKSDRIKKLIAAELGLTVDSLRRLIYANDPRLTQAGVLRILKTELGVEQTSDLLSEIKVKKVVS